MEAEKQIADFVDRLKQAAGANLECIALFGSAASDEFHADYSDINILCITRELSPPVLAALAPAIHAWTRKKFPAPLIFSRTELERSADVFPIEMLDLNQRHRILYGEDIFAGMKVPMERHRVQLEHNLRTKLLTLRQSYMQAVGDEKRIRRLMLDSVSTFSTLFRHTLIAMGEQPAPHKADNIRKLAERIKFDPGIYLQLLEVRERKAKENQIDVAAGFAKYMDGINAVVQAVDAL
ncbi:MAG TPA: nucleotidyltransferase domain-containing protein [Candidatus Angelobacter sp.]|nr:nucleotidyltransferase domain-containing protein [Candidatus Angelobacter sp.]